MACCRTSRPPKRKWMARCNKYYLCFVPRRRINERKSFAWPQFIKRKRMSPPPKKTHFPHNLSTQIEILFFFPSCSLVNWRVTTDASVRIDIFLFFRLTLCPLGKPCRKRRRETTLSVVSDPFRAFDEATMFNLFSPSMWEAFFSSGADIAAQYQRLEKQLLDSGLAFCEVKSDGNCQFRALSHQIYGTEDAHSIVRALLVREISNNPQRYQRFMGTNGMSCPCS